MNAFFMEITVELAIRWLHLNTANYRGLDHKRVNRYAIDMAEDRWLVNGQTITFAGTPDDPMRLLDGQHRLHAIVKSGRSIRSLVAFGVIQGREDEGKARNLGTELSNLGYKSGFSLSAVGRGCLAHRLGKWGDTTWQCDLMTPSQILEYVKQNYDGLLDAIRLSSKCRPLIQTSILGPIVFIGSGGSPNSCSKVMEFTNRLESGDGLQKDSPILHLRNRLAVPGQKRLSPFYARVLTTICWNKFVQDKPMRTLRFIEQGEKKTKPPGQILTATQDQF